MKRKLMKFIEGHLSIGPLTIFGLNAMHVALQLSTRWGYLCFHPGWGQWPWTLYLSPVATPWASTFAAGPGIDRQQILLAPIRRALFGHGFDTGVLGEYAPYLAIEKDAEASVRQGLRRIRRMDALAENA